MQAYAPLRVLQVFGGASTLLRSVSALPPAPPSLCSNLVSSQKPIFRGAAAQIPTVPFVSSSALALSQHNRSLNKGFRSPTHSILLPHAQALAARRSFHHNSLHTPSLCRQAQPPVSPRVPRLARPLSISNPLASLFGSNPHPSPLVLARLSKLETVANTDPTDVPAQIVYYQALLDIGQKRGYDRVLSRWERTLEFDQHNPILRSDEAFRIYLMALVRSGLQSSVNNAVERRERVLALPPPVVPDAAASSPGTSSDTSATAKPASKSHEIAQSVLTSRLAWTPPSPGVFGDESTAKHSTLGVGGGLGGAGGDKQNPVHVILSEPKGSTIFRIIRFLVLAGVIGFIMLVLMAVVFENSGLLKAGPTNAEFEPVVGKTVKFSDVHGVDEAKDELQEVVEFLKDPTNFATLGGKLPKGVLLTGPPGTGKTMLARAVAGEAGVPFLFASGSEFDEMFVGIGAKRIRDLFAAARKKQPAIIFIDELDAIGSKRSPRDQHYMKQTLNQLLVELDGFQQTEGVIVIAATNFPQSLDDALVRPGRFDRKISVPLPDVQGRMQILKHHMQNVTTSTDVDAKVIARGTPGFSGADLQNMVNQAAIQASREGSKFVLLKHFEWAKDRIVMGAERRSAYIAPHVKKLTAYHEGGHALVALYTEGAMPLHKVTCMPRGHALGYTSQLPEDDRFSVSYKEYIADMDVCLGGRVAEELVYGPENVTSGCISDLARATGVATRMVQSLGYSQKLGPVYYSDQDLQTMSSRKREEIEGEVRTLVEAAQARARELLTSREEELHRLAKALVEYETLNLEEVRKVIRGEKIRENEEPIQDPIQDLVLDPTPDPAQV